MYVRYELAQKYSKIAAIETYAQQFAGYDLAAVLDRYKRQIQLSVVPSSEEETVHWLNHMTRLVDMLGEIQDNLWAELLQQLSRMAKETMVRIGIGITVILAVVVACPMMFRTLLRMLETNSYLTTAVYCSATAYLDTRWVDSHIAP